MAQPRPSLTLILDLDERLDSEDVRLEIDRCYSYVGSTLVRTPPACAPPGGPPPPPGTASRRTSCASS